MKVLAVIGVLAVFSCAFANANANGPLAALAEQCKKVEQPSEEALARLHQGDFSQQDQKLKCYTKCVFGNAGVWTNGAVQQGKVNEILGQYFPLEVIAAAAARCNNIRGVDDCDSLYKIYKCYYENKSANLIV